MTMRKFKVWDNQENKWFESVNEAYKGNIQQMFLSESGELCLRTLDQFTHCPSVFPGRYVVVFSTGINDKNGVEIYTTDILKFDLGRKPFDGNYEVYFCEEEGRFKTKSVYKLNFGEIISNSLENH